MHTFSSHIYCFCTTFQCKKGMHKSCFSILPDHGKECTDYLTTSYENSLGRKQAVTTTICDEKLYTMQSPLKQANCIPYGLLWEEASCILRKQATVVVYHNMVFSGNKLVVYYTVFPESVVFTVFYCSLHRCLIRHMEVMRRKIALVTPLFVVVVCGMWTGVHKHMKLIYTAYMCLLSSSLSYSCVYSIIICHQDFNLFTDLPFQWLCRFAHKIWYIWPHLLNSCRYMY